MKRNIYIILLFFVSVCFLNGCDKKSDKSSDVSNAVIIRIQGVNHSSEKILAKSMKDASDEAPDDQGSVFTLPNGVVMTATLTVVNEKKKNLNRNKVAAATNVSEELSDGVAYRVVVYNTNGTYKVHKDFKYGDAATITGLDDEKTYTFIAYSVNTSNVADLPTLNTSQNLNDVSIDVDRTHEYLMYYKTQLTMDYELPNYLDVVLTHKFAQITTIVSIDNKSYSRGARIKSIPPPVLSPERMNAILKLTDGSLTYGGFSSGKQLSGGAISEGGVQVVAFDPVNIISEDVTNAVMNFPSLTISTGSTVGAFVDMRNNNFDISNLKIKPGHRYNLNLNIVMPCVERVESTLLYTQNWAQQGDGFVHESGLLEFESSDYGVEINIFELDQSFQLLINGSPIFTREAEFEYFGPGSVGDSDDVRFVADDGRYWFDTYQYSIYELSGDYATNSPIVRVVIDVNGNVSMYGSRVSYGTTVVWDNVVYGYALEPLRLTNGNGFNQVQWNTSSPNTVLLKQTETGPTNITFNAIGYKKVVCP